MTEQQRGVTRRSVLAGAALTTAGIAVGAGGATALLRSERAPTPTAPEREGGAGFDHLVVVMFENRSFDNVFGWLYSAAGVPVPAGQSFEGLDGVDAYNLASDGTRIDAHIYEGPTDAIMSSPSPNAGEEYPHINTQLFGTVDPPENAGLPSAKMQPPYNAPPAGVDATMTGFVQDYINNYRVNNSGAEPTLEQYRAIMGGFDPKMLPVFSTLARSFAVFDHWHSAVPSQTFANRSFVHAGTSHGLVVNKGEQGFSKWIDPSLNDAPTIFNRLEDAGISWAVYFDESQLISLTGLIHAPQLEPFWKTNFRTMTQFHHDAAEGLLPAYAFIEPRMIYNHNDMHPPTGKQTLSEVDGEIVSGSAISDARAGDTLLHEIYTSVRESISSEGSNALNTMLLVTFDETGGTYDHVPPPAATPPDASGPGELGFGFDRLGVRVPAIAISAYTAEGTVVNDPVHHGAIIRTLCEQYDLPHLTDRDKEAGSITAAVTLTAPRPQSTWPVTSASFVPANPEATAGAAPDRALSEPAVGLLNVLLAKYGQPGDPLPKTYSQAEELLDTRGRNLFGSD